MDSTAASRGFGRLLASEWIKLRSVPRWTLALVIAVGFTAFVSFLGAEGNECTSGPDEGDGGEQEAGCDAAPVPDYRDEVHLVHRQIAGDGSIVAHIESQEPSHEWAKAGIMLRSSVEQGSSYAAILVTPEHGVRFQASAALDIVGSERSAPRWLKLTRSGNRVTGYESTDGSTWNRVGSVELDSLPQTVEVGPFAGSPNKVDIVRQAGGESINETVTMGSATFADVRLEAEQPLPSSAWRDLNSLDEDDDRADQVEGTFTLFGTGDIGPFEDPYADDVIETSLTSVIVGLLAVVALSVLFVTSEYRQAMIRTTFAASPHRGQVLAAKAIVIGATGFVVGLVASLGAFLLSEPLLRSSPSPDTSLTDWPVLRAVVGTAVLVALAAVLSLAVGTILRRSASAIAIVVALLAFPKIVETGMPLMAAKWMMRLTPAAGFAIQETARRYDTAIGPLAGIAVLAVYTAAALALAGWRLRRRDA